MLRSRISLVVLLAACLVSAGSTIARADELDHVAARQAREKGEILSLARILDAANAEFSGEVVEVELEREKGRWEYEVELLTAGGAVIELTYDAATGRLLGTEGAGVERARKRP
ncbi:MAG: PepSY domain-containing protein [Deltaproteobacteria bacterium]|nr:PepSY domain-containing protein [Deltaproteobacteria bacterium]